VVGSVLGTRVVRKEDPKFLTTGGVYVDDLRDVPELDRAAVVAYARSPVAHGTITSLDVEEARALPGVIAVFTASDLGLEPTPAPYNPNVLRTQLAADRVRYVGEPIAVVVAETARQAADAVETIYADIDPLPVVVDPEEALTTETVLHEGNGSNIVFDSTFLGKPGLTDDAFFDGCEVVAEGRLVNQRVAPCPLEVRGAAAAWDGDRITLWTSTQHAQGVRTALAAAAGVDEANARVITPDVGGGFGAKISAYPEELLLPRLAKEIGRPVTWRETRSESMTSLGHGRAQVQYVTIGGTRDGDVTHYRLRIIQDSGAYTEVGTVLAAAMTHPMAAGVYKIPHVECNAVSVVTNTTPVVAYRGAGRPEATAAVERAMDLFAAEAGIDAVEVRRRNLIPKFDEPYTTASEQTYDCGDYESALDAVLERAGYAELRAEQAARRASGDRLQLGIGVSTYVEITGGVPPFGEAARIEVDADGGATVYTGTSPHGQGHATAWAMLAFARTGIPIDQIDIVWGDTDLTPVGGGTMGSRSLQQGGSAVDQAAAGLVEQAKKLAAAALEASEADIVLDVENGSFHVAGTPSMAVSWATLAGDAIAAGGELAQDTSFESAGPTYPFGAHVAVVEVDTETGRASLIRHVACDDAGVMINPLLVEGQVHGGIAQGAAQALLEEVCYDSDGNPITSNLADYAMISATELPSFEVVHHETPTPVNPLGAKGIGESGTIGATPAVQSAVVDAVSHLGVRHIDMPATPERVWRAFAAVG
jgi:carbon-monoxide dehydrogenase large subunit